MTINANELVDAINRLSQEELDEAIIQFHKADELKKTADKMREASRNTILLALEEGLCLAGDISAGGKKVQITVPMSKAKPSEFNQAKATEFHEFVEDAYPLLLPAFTKEVTYTVSFEVLVALLKAVDGDKDALLSRVETFITPAVESKPLEPRLKAS